MENTQRSKIMRYLEFTFHLTPASVLAQEVLSAVLADIGFDSFIPTESGANPLLAYIKADVFDAAALDATLSAYPLPDTTVTYERHEMEDKNWNEEWEKNYYQPLVVDGRCVVASTFHKEVPQAEYTILINPRMSFGTGHHATTSQMLSEILQTDCRGLNVLDMGCGTSILAILARMRGAAHCTAIDNDEWCVANSLENIALNGLDGIDVALGDASSLAGKEPFDLVLANINRNILLADIEQYVVVMKPGARIFMSGFFKDDIDKLHSAAEPLGLRLLRTRDIDRWACLVFEKA